MGQSRRLVWETFVVRLWRESLDTAWRGQIVHLASRESSYFATFAQVEAFISRFAHGLSDQTDSADKEEENARLDDSQPSN